MADQTPTLHIYALGPPKVRLGENFTQAMASWVEKHGVELALSQPVNPLKMLTFSASIEPTGKMCWMPTCSPD